MLILPTYSSVDIATSEGPVNLAWPAIMKTLQEDPQDFYKMGGWTFLTGDGSDEEDSESSAESEFAASDEGVSESEADSESDGTSCMGSRLPSP
jgi:nucleosome binding factor SPN SPT16 subunit